MEEPKDKRTKAYKEWKSNQTFQTKEVLREEAKIKYVVNPNPVSKGLGDTVEKILDKTGVKKAVQWLSNGKDCGCDKRKQLLNEKFRYKHPECMVESEHTFWTEYLKRHNPESFSKRDIFEIDRLYRRLFRQRISICAGCGKSAIRVLNRTVETINTVYDTYEIND